MPIAGRLLQSPRMHVYMSIGALATIAGVAGFSLASEPMHFFICGLFTGFGMPYLYGLAEVTLIGNWFCVEKQGKYLGLCMACQGLAAAIWAPLFTQIVQALGYQTAYLINAALIAAFTLPWTTLVIRRDPKMMGTQAYGVEEGEPEQASVEADAYVGMSRRGALRTAGFWATLIAACTICLGMGFENHQQAIAVNFLGQVGVAVPDALLTGSIMMSCFGIGTVVGDVAFGSLMEHLRFRTVFTLYLLLFVMSFALWLCFQTFVPALLLGSFLMGSHNGLASVGYPLLVRRLFGGIDYSRIFAIVNMCCSFFGGCTTMLVSIMHDTLHSYSAVLVAAIVIGLFLMAFSWFAISRIGRYLWRDEKGNKVESYRFEEEG